MPYANAGDVYTREVGKPDLRILRVNWRMNSNGIACAPLGDIDGTLHRFVSYHVDSALSVAYSVAVYDQFDSDVLVGLGGSLTHNVTTGKSIYKALSTDRVRPVVVAGRHTFRVTLASGTTQTFGVFDLYWFPKINREVVNG